jgi:hypothetical protein
MPIVTKKIDPDPRIWRILGRANYTVADAISELCANSFDAKLVNLDEEIPVPLTIWITISDHEVSVVDDGKGMDVEILGSAMRLGVDMDAVTGNKAERKGMYGLGMKIACASLGTTWKVSTRPINLEEENSVETNLDEWHTDRERGWEIDIDNGRVDPKGPLADKVHGTAIVITRLNDRNHEEAAKAVVERLQRAYVGALKAGDRIYVNGQEIIPKSHEFRDGFRHEIQREVDGHVVTGLVGLDRVYHNDGEYGLNLYRNGQLVELWNKQFFKAHTTTSLVRGDLNLDFVPANVTKTGFEKQSNEWKLALEAMRDELSTIVGAARKLQGAKKNPTLEAGVQQGFRKAMDRMDGQVVVEAPEGDGHSTHAAPAPVVVPARDVPPKLGMDMKSIIIEGIEIKIATTVKALPDMEIPWSYILDRKASELIAVMNSNSAIYSDNKDSQLVGALAISEAIFQLLTREHSYSNDKAFTFRNQYLTQLAATEMEKKA